MKIRPVVFPQITKEDTSRSSNSPRDLKPPPTKKQPYHPQDPVRLPSRSITGSSHTHAADTSFTAWTQIFSPHATQWAHGDPTSQTQSCRGVDPTHLETAPTGRRGINRDIKESVAGKPLPSCPLCLISNWLVSALHYISTPILIFNINIPMLVNKKCSSPVLKLLLTQSYPLHRTFRKKHSSNPLSRTKRCCCSPFLRPKDAIVPPSQDH